VYAAIFGQLLGDFARVFDGRARQEMDLGQLLPGKCQPIPQFRIELALFVSSSTSTGMCIREQEGEISMRSGPRRSTDRRIASNAQSRSVRQMFRPSTTPSESSSPAGAFSRATVNWPGSANEIQVQPGYRQGGPVRGYRADPKSTSVKTLLPGVDKVNRL